MEEQDVYDTIYEYLLEANYVKRQKLFDRVVCGERSRQIIGQHLLSQGVETITINLVNRWINERHDELMALCEKRRSI